MARAKPGQSETTTIKFSETKRAEYIRLLESGVRRMAAAEQVGLAYSTIWRAMAHDEEFKIAVDLAEMRADEDVEDAMFQAAVSGNVTAMQVWLYNRRPERWRDMRQLAMQGRIDSEHREVRRLEIVMDRPLTEVIGREQLPAFFEQSRQLAQIVRTVAEQEDEDDQAIADPRSNGHGSG